MRIVVLLSRSHRLCRFARRSHRLCRFARRRNKGNKGNSSFGCCLRSAFGLKTSGSGTSESQIIKKGVASRPRPSPTKFINSGGSTLRSESPAHSFLLPRGALWLTQSPRNSPLFWGITPCAAWLAENMKQALRLLHVFPEASADAVVLLT